MAKTRWAISQQSYKTGKEELQIENGIEPISEEECQVLAG